VLSHIVICITKLVAIETKRKSRARLVVVALGMGAQPLLPRRLATFDWLLAFGTEPSPSASTIVSVNSDGSMT